MYDARVMEDAVPADEGQRGEKKRIKKSWWLGEHPALTPLFFFRSLAPRLVFESAAAYVAERMKATLDTAPHVVLTCGARVCVCLCVCERRTRSCDCVSTHPDPRRTRRATPPRSLARFSSFNNNNKKYLRLRGGIFSPPFSRVLPALFL